MHKIPQLWVLLTVLQMELLMVVVMSELQLGR
jgi:hypothetical protein